MNVKNGPEKISKILKQKQPEKPPAYQWQEFALRIIKELGVPSFKKNSVFKAAKEYPRPVVEKCLSDTKELCQRGAKWKYFFKLISQNRKRSS